MEEEKFLEIRALMCLNHQDVTEGKMMSSPAIHYQGKVFAFFSKKQKMVFKFGNQYPMEELEVSYAPFNPFKTKKPLAGWYEIDYEHHLKWKVFTELALRLARKNLR